MTLTDVPLGAVVAAAALALLGVCSWAVLHFLRIAPVAAGYKAKILCSAIFVSKRNIDPRFAADVSADSYRLLRIFRSRVDAEARTVTCSWLGLQARTACYRPGLGATLMAGTQRSPVGDAVPTGLAGLSAATDWPRRAESKPEQEPEALRRVVDAAFTEPAPRKLRRTRAVVIVHDGQIVSERYAEGFSRETALPGWSVTKSVLSALVGILVRDQRLSLEDRALLPEWRSSTEADSRAAITLEDLLRMRSGLAFTEVYSDLKADVTQMLYARSDMAAFAAGKLLSAPPGTSWQYSSGTTNILSRLIRHTVGEGEYHAFPRRALFGPLGMTSAVMEPDAAGTFVGSSYMFATARDWARFGQFYLQDGMWDGQRILPEGWVRFSTTPTVLSPDGCYGAHWWLKLSQEFGGGTEAASSIPPDAFFAIGHEGQVLTVIPSRRLVVVRLGLSIYVDAWNHAHFIADVLEALPSKNFDLVS